MCKLNYFVLFLFGLKLNLVFANYNGPFLFWGVNDLSGIKLSSLESIDDKVLRDLYSDSSAVIMFLRNSSTKLTKENYPELKEIVDNSKWAYIPQKWLSSDPVDYNVNAEIINLVGPSSQQDVEMTALFHDAEINYGKGKVLGILATKWNGHVMQKREVSEESTPIPISMSTATPTDEPSSDNFTYYTSKGSILMQTTSAPFLKIITENPNVTNSNSSDYITTTMEIKYCPHQSGNDYPKEGYSRLILSCKLDEGKINLRFRFEISSGYWTPRSVEVEDDKLQTYILNVTNDNAKTPIGFSYKCYKGLEFTNKNKTMSLIFNDIQVQAVMGSTREFSEAYDCIGFVTAPILSGVLVSFLLIIGVSIAIAAILDIKPPNRFENSRNKQLTFTIQE